MAKDESIACYRECFSSAAGRRVLASILAEGKFFAYTHTPEEQAVENFVKTILAKTGAYPVAEGDMSHSIDAYVNKLFELPFKLGD